MRRPARNNKISGTLIAVIFILTVIIGFSIIHSMDNKTFDKNHGATTENTQDGSSNGPALPNDSPQLSLEGKTLVCFGDSLFGNNRGDTSTPSYIAERTGATVYNVGFGGCRMAVHPYTGYNEFSMWALATAITQDDWTAQDAAAEQGSSYFPDQLEVLKSIDFHMVDAIVIHYGTNDFAGGVQIDAVDDPLDTATLCGAMRYSIETILTAYPELKIFISLPVYRYWTSEDGSVVYPEDYLNRNQNTLIEFVEAIRAVAKEYNLSVIDGYYELGIDRTNAATYLSDGVHHTAEGRKRFGYFIASRILADYS